MKVCNHYQHQHPPSSAFIVQHASFIMQHSACIIQHASFSMHHSASITPFQNLRLDLYLLTAFDLELPYLGPRRLKSSVPVHWRSSGKNESTLCLFNLAMENGPPIDDKHDDLPIKMVISHSYVSHNQRVNININWLVVYLRQLGWWNSQLNGK